MATPTKKKGEDMWVMTKKMFFTDHARLRSGSLPSLICGNCTVHNDNNILWILVEKKKGRNTE